MIAMANPKERPIVDASCSAARFISLIGGSSCHEADLTL